MPRIGVIGEADAAFDIINAIHKLCKVSTEDWKVGTDGKPGYFSPQDISPFLLDLRLTDAENCPIIIINQHFPEARHLLGGLKRGDIVIANTDEKGMNRLIAGCKALVITYGYNARACVTASSVTDLEVQCCVQRAFFDIYGKKICEQEFPARIQPAVDVHSILAAVTAAMVCGVNIDMLYGAPIV